MCKTKDTGFLRLGGGGDNLLQEYKESTRWHILFSLGVGVGVMSPLVYRVYPVPKLLY